MYKVQFNAQAIDEDGHATSGWVDKSRPFELRDEPTDVAEYEFETYEEAHAAVLRFIGEFSEVDRDSYIICYGEDTEDNYETGETFSYSAVIESE